MDPITAAVLASSLSVEAAGDGRGPQQPPASMQQRLNAAHSVAMGTGGYGGAAASAQAGPPGKHQFFGVFSGTTGAGSSGGSARPGPSSAYLAGSTRQGSARGPSPTAAGSRPGAGSLSLNHPLVMHPTVAHSAGAGAGAGASARGGPAGPSGAGGGGPGRARFASTDMYAPGKLVRAQELDELDHRAAAAAAAAEGGRPGALMHAKPWLTGPFKSSAGTGAVTAGAGRGAGKGGAAAAEEEELAALREKWTAMDSKTSASVADVQVRPCGGCWYGAVHAQIEARMRVAVGLAHKMSVACRHFYPSASHH